MLLRNKNVVREAIDSINEVHTSERVNEIHREREREIGRPVKRDHIRSISCVLRDQPVPAVLIVAAQVIDCSANITIVARPTDARQPEKKKIPVVFPSRVRLANSNQFD